MFVPMTSLPAFYLVIVALDDGKGRPDLSTLRVFHANSKQAFNYSAGTWHHPMVGLGSIIDFACLVWELGEKCTDPLDDCEEVFFTEEIICTEFKPTSESFQSFPNIASNANGAEIIFATGNFL